MNQEELEAERQEELRSLDPDVDLNRFALGTFGCHELVDRASVLMNQFDDLCRHPACLIEPGFYQRAHKAFDAIFNFYEVVAERHLSATKEKDYV